MKVRHKPLVLDAFQWTGDAHQAEDPQWFTEAIKKGDISFINAGTPVVMLRIRTAAGTLYAERGDWIIRGVEGELSPCMERMFKQTYQVLRTNRHHLRAV